MSLIIARKEGKQIFVISDTKLTFPDITFPIPSVSDPKEGVIKTVIIHYQICISFAGIVEVAENAIKNCRKLNGEPDKIITYLLKEHLEAKAETEFIVCIGNPFYMIVEIKNNKSSIVDHCWIGSSEGFNIFQKCLNEKKATVAKDKKEDYASLSQDAFKEVLQSSLIPEVSGFKITVKNDGGFFIYSQSIEWTIPPQTIEFNDQKRFHVLGHGTAEQGGYSINIFPTSTNVNILPIHILQGRFGIIYKVKNEGILYPDVISNVDDHEFNELLEENYGVKSPYVISSKQISLSNRGDKAYAEKNYQKAIDFYSRGLLEKENLTPILYFNRALCYLNLKKFNEARLDFNEAVKLDSGLKQKAIQYMSQAVQQIKNGR